MQAEMRTMKQIEHWNGDRMIDVGESKGGVLATVHPLENLVRGDVLPWPTPELLQKFYESRWQGASRLDDEAVRRGIGHYCALQSLNSEDAITWSFFGPIAYSSPQARLAFTSALLLKLTPAVNASSTEVAIWLWRRVPHPEKPGSTGGPEIDFGLLTGDTFVVGEAKWNSGLGAGQGVAKNRTQFDLRRAFCDRFGSTALGDVRRWIILGVGRKADVFPADGFAKEDRALLVRNLTWPDLAILHKDPLRSELLRYLSWKERFSTQRPGRDAQTSTPTPSRIDVEILPKGS